MNADSITVFFAGWFACTFCWPFMIRENPVSDKVINGWAISFVVAGLGTLGALIWPHVSVVVR